MMLNTYEQFSNLNNELITYLNELISDDLKEKNSEEIINNFNRILNDIEELKLKSDEIVSVGIELNKVNNLRYSIMNSLFLISDLLHFYKLNEIERFRMRAVNYVNHNSKPQVFR
ncbi:Uncharacterised protein [uncultured Clostridium sp.]|uniref:hypothetical protein n=1 Tax=uncultured Clostridium sp. TaxID=59620 RepID=UPI000822013F|nr:hypothetical protein [uncultured Clostridium sp.]SCJ99209.1 Uncharacterised protein [uncultured Clostridium sp.]